MRSEELERGDEDGDECARERASEKGNNGEIRRSQPPVFVRRRRWELCRIEGSRYRFDDSRSSAGAWCIRVVSPAGCFAIGGPPTPVVSEHVDDLTRYAHRESWTCPSPHCADSLMAYDLAHGIPKSGEMLRFRFGDYDGRGGDGDLRRVEAGATSSSAAGGIRGESSEGEPAYCEGAGSKSGEFAELGDLVDGGSEEMIPSGGEG